MESISPELCTEPIHIGIKRQTKVSEALKGQLLGLLRCALRWEKHLLATLISLSQN